MVLEINFFNFFCQGNMFMLNMASLYKYRCFSLCVKDRKVYVCTRSLDGSGVCDDIWIGTYSISVHEILVGQIYNLDHN